MAKMNVVTMVKQAVEQNDAQMAGFVADACRFRDGMTYAQTYAFAHEHTGISAADWETLMEASDSGR